MSSVRSTLSLSQSLILVLLLQCSYHVTDSKKGNACPPIYASHKADFLCGCTADFAEEMNGAPVSKGPAKLWPGGLVFYAIDKDFDVWFQNKIMATLEIVERLTGKDHFEFILIRDSKGDLCAQDQYILIKRNSHYICDGHVGMNDGITTLHLDQNVCFEDYGILFPVLKALGLQSELNRSDRDKHVQVKMSEIFSDSCGFYKPREVPDATERLPYDPFSIMHPKSCDWSCRGNYTVLDLNSLPIQIFNYNITELDVEKLRTLYPKENKSALLAETCGRGSKDQKAGASTPMRSGHHKPVLYLDSDDAIKSTGAWKLTALVSVAMATLSFTLLT